MARGDQTLMAGARAKALTQWLDLTQVQDQKLGFQHCDRAYDRAG
jgi:hypothetical protein